MQIELLSITQNAERLIELAARICYNSQDKMTDDSHTRMIEMLIKNGHESPLEHASASFLISDVSRSLTHQLVRHRLTSVSQQSQRYVDAKHFSTTVPIDFDNWEPERQQEFSDDIKQSYALYEKWRAKGLTKEDARLFLNNATTTKLVFTANFREFRHIFKVRCSKHAQWEIRQCCNKMLTLLIAECPAAFGDLN